MSRTIKGGDTDQSTIIRIVDSGDGTPETGVTSATSGLALKYRREGATLTSISLSGLSALNDAHSDGGLLHIENGYYRLDLPDAAVAAGADGVLVEGTATGMVVIGAYHPLVAYDPQDTVRLGLTALPNAAADAAGGLPISDAGGLDLDALNSNLTAVLADTNELQTDWTNGGRLDLIVDAVLADTNELQGDWVNGGRLDLIVDAILADTDSLDSTKIPNTLSLANINAEVDTAIVTYGLDHLVQTSVTGTDVADNSIIAKLVSKSATADWDSFTNTTDALEAIADAAAPSASAIADAVWDELYAGHTTSGSFGQLVGAKLPLITANSVTVASVVDSAGNIKHIFRGGDHTLNPISIPIDGTTTDLSGSGFTLALRLSANASGSGDQTKCIIGGTVVSGGTASQTVDFALDASDTATLVVNAAGFDRNPTVNTYWAYKYQVVKISTGSPQTEEVVARGYASVVDLIECA